MKGELERWRKPTKKDAGAMKKPSDKEPNLKMMPKMEATKVSAEPVTVHGYGSKKRADRPGRKLGGAVGAERSPMSSASRCE